MTKKPYLSSKSPPKCPHKNCLVVEWVWGKRSYPDRKAQPDAPFRPFMNWRDANIYSAHKMRASRLLCLDCGKEIPLNLPVEISE